MHWRAIPILKCFLLAGLMLAVAGALGGCITAGEPFKPRPLPEVRHGHRMHLVGGRLYLIGGYGPSMASTKMLDPKTGQWIDQASMQVPKTFFASAVVGDLIYTIGGSVEHKGGVIERYDPARNQWDIVLTSERLPKTHLAAASVGPLIYIFGGFPDQSEYMLVFDTRIAELADAPRLPDYHKGDHFHFMANMGGRLHVLGGMRFHPDSKVMNQHWMLERGRWISRAPLPSPSMSKLASYGVLDGRLYIFDTLEKLHHAYDPETDRWSDAPATMPIERSMAATVVHDGKLYVFGGMPLRREAGGNILYIYDARTNQWERR